MNKTKHYIYKTCKLLDKYTRQVFDQELLYTLPEKQMVVLMTGYNNQQYVIESLTSALKQEYANYSIIYVDDASTDNTLLLVQDILATTNVPIALIKNTKRVGKLANLYNTIHALTDNPIIVELDADDYLTDSLALKRFNYIYSLQHALLVHANYKNQPEELERTFNLGHFSQQTPPFIKKPTRWPWIYSGLRSYYANLFKQIPQEKLLFEGNFIDIFHDAAIWYPMLALANHKIGYIQAPQLNRNIDSAHNDFKKDHKKLALIRQKVLNG